MHVSAKQHARNPLSGKQGCITRKPKNRGLVSENGSRGLLSENGVVRKRNLLFRFGLSGKTFRALLLQLHFPDSLLLPTFPAYSWNLLEVLCDGSPLERGNYAWRFNGRRASSMSIRPGLSCKRPASDGKSTACHMRRRIYACHMRRRIHACHIKKTNPNRTEHQNPIIALNTKTLNPKQTCASMVNKKTNTH